MQFVRWAGFLVASVVAALVSSGCSAASTRVVSGNDVPLQAVHDGGCASRDAGCVERPTDAGSNALDAWSFLAGTDAPGLVAKAKASVEEEDDEARAGDQMVDDEADSTLLVEQGEARPHPLDGWTVAQLLQTLVTQPKYLGSISIGRPNGGALVNGQQMEPGAGWTLVKPTHTWGTQEMIEDLTRCIERVRMQFPNTPPLYVGHMSAPRGGQLFPHRSHQSGRDVDVGYYYTTDEPWYARATGDNLDVARTWAFVRALVTEADVEYLFIDCSIQKLLRSHAYETGEPKAWVDSIFDGAPDLRPIVLHAKGHATHIHVRFYSPLAQETARRLYALLLERRALSPEGVYVSYAVKNGESLAKSAKQAGAPAKAVQDVNRLKTTLTRGAADYRTVRRGGVTPRPVAMVVPARRLPPGVAPPTGPGLVALASVAGGTGLVQAGSSGSGKVAALANGAAGSGVPSGSTAATRAPKP